LWSEQFDNAVWSPTHYLGTNPVITANYGISPDGTQNADRIQLARTNVNNSYSQIYQYPIAVTNGQQYTWSVYLKSLSGTPTISIVGDFGRPPVTLTSEWVRYTGTATATSSATQLEFAILGSDYATGNSLSADFLAYGYQFEQSSYPTSYIPTTSASATRVADAASKTGISSLIGQTEGTMFIDTYVGNETDEVYGWLQASLSGNPNDSIQINRAGSNVQCQVYNGGTVDGIITGGTIAKGQRIKIAVGYKQNDLVLYLNGTQIGVDTSTNIPTCAVFQLGAYPPLPNDYTNDGGINQAVLFKTRLTNAELASLTTL
jgi:hypothetical protein